MLWASFNIGAQSVPFAGASVDLSAGPATSAVKPGPPIASEATPTVLYPRAPAEGDRIGTLSIPALKQKIAIIEGTDDDDLKRGVGHYTRSVLPGEDDNCVLSGHRDTVFTRLGKLKVGDRFVARTSAGTFTYKIRRIRIVHKDDRTVIVSTDHAVLTVSTCYPFYFIGAAPDRYVLIADLVAPSPAR
jgi:sortase A